MIASFENTNIYSVNIKTKESFFEGVIMLFVKSTNQLNNVIEKIKSIKSIEKVDRYYDIH